VAVLLAALLLAPGSQRAGASEHEGAPAMTAEGEVRIVHVDYFERGRSETAYLLRDTVSGDTFELKFERRPPRLLRTGDRIGVRGRAVGRKLWVTEIVAGLDQEGTGEPAEPQAAAAADERRALLLVLNMPGDPNYYGQATVDSATGKMFTDGFSVDSLYLETSFGQFGFPGPGVGDVFGPLDIPYFAGCPWPNALYWIANAADAAATDAGIELSAYDNKFYLIPPKSISDCPWLAVGEVGFYGSTGVYRAWSTRNDTVAYAHELGHNLGWHHAAFDPDNDGSVNNVNEEYGDTSDIMGFCCSERKFNGAHVDQIGWFDASPADIVTVLAGGSYQIAPLGGGNGFGDPRILKIDKPDTSEVYYLSYRQPNGLDAAISSTYTRGVNIHHARETGIWSYFIDALVDGESFVDAVNGVTVTQVVANSDSVIIEIAFGDCNTAAPSVALGPPSQTTPGGGPVAYQVSVTNEDTTGCDPASFDLATGDLGGLAGDIVPSSLDLAAGTTGAATLTVQAVGADGGYTLWAWASDLAGLHDDAGGSASLEIDATPPLAPTGLTTAKKKRKGRFAVQVTWDAGIDPDPGSGVAAYRLYRDGAPVADTSDLGYIDRNVTDGDPYSYTLRAVDNAGNESGLSDTASYPPDGSDGGSGDGGSTGGKGYGKGGKPK
jgi:hypothetical protein